MIDNRIEFTSGEERVGRESSYGQWLIRAYMNCKQNVGSYTNTSQTSASHQNKDKRSTPGVANQNTRIRCGLLPQEAG